MSEMNEWRKNLGWLGLVLLAYGVLGASWFDGRAMPEVTRDLWVALGKGGVPHLILPLLLAFLGIYLAALMLGTVWLGARRTGWSIWAGVGPVVAGVGLMLTLWAFARGGDWQGTLTTALGFLGAGVGVWLRARSQLPEWRVAARQGERAWKAAFEQARAQGEPVTVAVCRFERPLAPEELQWVREQLRDDDQAQGFRHGLLLFLVGVTASEAIRVLQRIGQQIPLSTPGAHCGLACAPEHGQNLSDLIRYAEFARELAEIVGEPFKQVHDLRLPPALEATVEEPVSVTQLREVTVLRQRWPTLTQEAWQALVVHFAPPQMAAALQETARRLLRDEDVVVRISPHRLLVMLPKTDERGGAHVQEKLRRGLTPVAQEQGGEMRVYRLPVTLEWDWEQLLKAAYRLPRIAAEE